MLTLRSAVLSFVAIALGLAACSSDDEPSAAPTSGAGATSASSGAGGADAQGGAAGSGGASGEGGSCTPVEETCNQLDDDCDGAVDEGAIDAPLTYADADHDGFGDPATATASCSPPRGYVAQGGDCDDTDPSLRPGVAADPAPIVERCGQGALLHPMDDPAAWTTYPYPAETAHALDATGAGCLGGGLALSYSLGGPAPCGPVSCAYVVLRSVLPAPVDLGDASYLVVPFAGAPGDPRFDLEIKLEDVAGCRTTVRLDEATDLPVRRAVLLPLAAFTGGESTCPGQGTDVSAIQAVEIAVVGDQQGATPWPVRAGTLTLDAITALRADDLRVPLTSFECPRPDTVLMTRIAEGLRARSDGAVATLGHPLVASWYEEPAPLYHAYTQALALAVLSLEHARTGDPGLASAAQAVADELVSLQDAGRWADAYVDQPGVGLVAADPAFSWFGNVAWVVIGLDVFRDHVALQSSAAYDGAIALAASWLVAEVAAYEAAGGAPGGITDGTEGNLSSYFALRRAGRVAEADAMAQFLLDEAWDPVERRFWMGVSDPGLAIDVMGGWGVDFLRLRGADADALDSMGLAAGVFPVAAFDGAVTGMGDIAGPYQPTVEFTCQLVAAGGPWSYAHIDALLSLEDPAEPGSFPGAPDDYAGGPGWNTAWHGVAPSAWVYLALRGGLLREE
jgi:hypothetical protein